MTYGNNTILLSLYKNFNIVSACGHVRLVSCMYNNVELQTRVVKPSKSQRVSLQSMSHYLSTIEDVRLQHILKLDYSRITL